MTKNRLSADDTRRNSPQFQGENFQKNLDLVNQIKEIAAEKECEPCQLALSWLLTQGDVIVPISRTKRVKYLEENLNALQIRLTGQDVEVF